MGEFFLTRRARQDIADIGRYTQRRWGAKQRDRYLELFLAAFKKLANQSSLGRECDEIKHGLLSHLCESHVIYFRRVARGIEVLRILHQRMDARAHL
jgi:toxin ParE1/3/4